MERPAVNGLDQFLCPNLVIAALHPLITKGILVFAIIQESNFCPASKPKSSVVEVSHQSPFCGWTGTLSSHTILETWSSEMLQCVPTGRHTPTMRGRGNRGMVVPLPFEAPFFPIEFWFHPFGSSETFTLAESSSTSSPSLRDM